MVFGVNIVCVCFFYGILTIKLKKHYFELKKYVTNSIKNIQNIVNLNLNLKSTVEY